MPELEKRVFFSRCRPQGADVAELAREHSRVFIGWPAWREKGAVPVPGKLRDSIVDPRCSDEEWKSYLSYLEKEDRSQHKKQYQQNRNLFRSIEPGAIALIPRPSLGYVLAGKIKTGFELLDDPPWGDEYLKLRRNAGCSNDDNEFKHLGDIAQSCEVEEFVEIPFPLIPAWIRRSLFGMSTYGHIWPLSGLESEVDPYGLLESLMERPERSALEWTSDLDKIERRLVDGVGPSSFEHLCVALLQLQEPQHIWVHVGGSGDGGLDGIGSTDTGSVVGLLQCKFSFGGKDTNILDKRSPVRKVFASLLPPDKYNPRADIEFWSRQKIATLVLKHARSLPLATTLRIGSPS